MNMKIIDHTRMILEDMGLNIYYPELRRYNVDNDGKILSSVVISAIQGRRVSIEQNPYTKFLLIFSMFDLYVDCCYPNLEGMSFCKKYKLLPRDNDYDIIFCEVFRLAKVIRNMMVHHPSGINGGINNISYEFKGTKYLLKIDGDGLCYLHTAMVMFSRGYIYCKEYFTAIIRSIYYIIFDSIELFSDEFGSELHDISEGVILNSSLRYQVRNVDYNECDGEIRLIINKEIIDNLTKNSGIDFHILFKGGKYVIPLEILDNSMSIEIKKILNWKLISV